MRKILLLITFACLSIAADAQKRGAMPTVTNPAGRAAKSASSASTLPMPTKVIPATASAEDKPAVPGVGDNDPVITLRGLCSPDHEGDAQACTTSISREQFEDILSAVSLSGQAFSPGAIRNVADHYVQNLILSEAALRKGIDKDPRIQKLLALVRMRTLAEAYRHAAEEKYRTPSAEEISLYYRDHKSQYEAVKAERVFIPKFNPKAPKEAATEFEKKAQTVAGEIRTRAGKGESFDKLQNEACARLGIPAPAFLPESGLRRRASFPADVVDEVFALKPGEVSKIREEAGGFAIYRLMERDTYTLEQVKGEIVRDIFRQKMEGDVKGVLRAVKTEMNPQYFAPTLSEQKTAPPGPAPGAKAQASRMQSAHSYKMRPRANHAAAAATAPSGVLK